MSLTKDIWRNCALAGLCLAISGCSPARTFDGLAAGFGRFEADLASTTNAPKAENSNEEGSVELPRLAYNERVPGALADRRKINSLIAKYARTYNVPVSLVHRVVHRESTYRANARNGIHLGLMQLNPQTARTMGYRGPDAGLYDAETNLKYGVKYLRGALMVAQGNHDRADKLYQSGYYYHAKRMGLLQATGLRP